MPLELAALLAAIQTSRKLISEGIKLAGDIKSGFTARNQNKEIQANLTATLASVEERLTSIGNVAEITESYLRTYENIRNLLAACEELMQFLKDSRADLAAPRSAAYTWSWERVESAYRRLGADSDAPRRVMLDRAEWYDKRDKVQIEGSLKEFTGAFNRAKGYVESRRLDGIESELENMIRPLTDARILLSDTVYDDILPSLQRLKA